MTSGFVVIGDELVDHPDQVGLVQDDDMIESLPPEGSDHPLRVGVLPRRPERGQNLGEPHASCTPGNGFAKDGVVVVDQKPSRKERRPAVAGRPTQRSGEP